MRKTIGEVKITSKAAQRRMKYITWTTTIYRLNILLPVVERESCYECSHVHYRLSWVRKGFWPIGTKQHRRVRNVWDDLLDLYKNRMRKSALEDPFYSTGEFEMPMTGSKINIQKYRR